MISVAESILLVARALLEQDGVTIEVVSLIADAVAKTAFLVQKNTSVAAPAPVVVPVVPIVSDSAVAESPTVVVTDTAKVTTSATVPTSTGTADTDSADWYE